MPDFTRVRWDSAYKLSSFLAEAFPDAWNAVEEKVPDVIPDA